MLPKPCDETLPSGYSVEEYKALRLYTEIQLKRLLHSGVKMNYYTEYFHTLNLYTESYRNNPTQKGKLVLLYRDFEASKSKILWMKEHTKPDPVTQSSFRTWQSDGR